MPKNNETCDVLVVGAGPVGLFAANELNRHGLTCRIIDKKPAISHEPNELGLYIRTLEVFEDCGLVHPFIEQGHKIEGISVISSGKHILDTRLNTLDASHHYLLTLPQAQTENILYQQLRNKALQIEWQTELVELLQNNDSVQVKMKNSGGEIKTLTASWLLACDGANSSVRKLLNLEFPGELKRQHWWLADVKVRGNLPSDRLTIYLHTDGLLLCFPLGEERYRFIMFAPTDGPEKPLLHDISEVIKQRCPTKLSLSDPERLIGYIIDHHQVENYRDHRVFIAGDAAHISSPLGWQSINIGLQDIYNLIWKLSLVHHDWANEQLLDSYQAERYPIAKELVTENNRVAKLTQLKSPLAIYLRDQIMSFMASFDSVKEKFAAELSELSIAYKESPIIEQHGSFQELHAGRLIPNIELKQGEILTSIFKILSGTQHHLLLFSGSQKTDLMALAQVANSIAKKYAGLITGHLVLITHAHVRDSDWDGSVLYDTEEYAHERLHATHDCAFLIRPDKYVGFAQTPINEKVLVKYLEKIFLHH